ncbi:hypothetical protein [Clostridium sp. DL1XJH146]
MIKYDESTYKAVKNAGSAGIVLGIISIVTGVTIGIISIIFGGALLNKKKNLID